MDLAGAFWTEVSEASVNVAVVPVGSVEQHGPHAPLGTDVLTAEAVADEAINRYGGDALRAPTIPVGVAEEHRHFAGTLWVSPDTFRAYVRETVTSLASHGVDVVIFVNGHGGNVTALEEVSARLTRDGTARVVPFTWFEHVGEHRRRMGHGGPLETALLMCVRPDLVRTDRLDDARDGGTDRWGEWLGRVNLAYDAAEFSENGVVGDPTAADETLGERLLELATDALVELIAMLIEDR